MFSFLRRFFGTAQTRTLAKYQVLVDAINAKDKEYASLSDEEIKAHTASFKARFQKGESLDDLLVEAFATVKSACRRMQGHEFHVSGYNQKWDMIPYDVQLLGSIALHNGYITEMQTGEGKTLTALLPLYLNALTSKPVHIVTANDYLAKRDCEWVGTVLRWLGLTTGVIIQEFPYDERKPIYECDVVYGTASEFGFDYLRDNSVAHRRDELVQRGFYYALIDEVDSILIDEARTPLIISGPSTVSKQLYNLLQEPIQKLVAMQKEFCNSLALTAKKSLERALREEAELEQKNFTAEEKEAIRKLWLVNKGTPRNKILKRLREDPDIRAELDTWDLYYYAEANKEERAKVLTELYIIIEEKSSEYELTDKGIAAWQSCGGNEDDFVMLDLGDEYSKIDQNIDLSPEEKIQKKLKLQEEDTTRKERAHNLRQMLRAHLLMEKDVDYMVQDGKVIIIDENTGRAQPGRRFSDGLHQAIEAKECCTIQQETQTYATITVQNYFRMYEKLAGMTGTAITEAHEFKEIYKLEVIQVPTNKPCHRVDANDEMYMTEREKYNAILKEIKTVHERGQPILVGTESVEISEKLSRIFKLNRLEHTVLNAKNNEREAEIISNAGQRGAITLSTNMAGRGTDIKLGAGIADLGGLHVVGTTRHQSRRIDRQLRGRSGRQGDPGSSKFFISLEDPLMRLFSSPSLTGLLQRFRPPEGEPISASLLNKSIETAQKRIEQRNYMIRKHTLEYDDVMNKQRQEIYSFRYDLIFSDTPLDIAKEVLENICLKSASIFFKSRQKELGWDPEGFRLFLMQHFPVTFNEGFFDDDRADTEELAQKAFNKLYEVFLDKLNGEEKKARLIMRNDTFDAKPMIGDAVRGIMIHTIDQLWQEHLLAMDHLRNDVHLRSVGQKDPLMEFKHEAFILFDSFTHHVRIQMANSLFRFEIVPAPEMQMQQFLQQLQLERERSLVGELAAEAPAIPTGDTPIEPPVEPISTEPKAGRNEPCPCGSGKKYKKCCGVHEGEE